MPPTADVLPVTVVTPVYNRAVLLREALESVARQTIAPAEVIVVDDGSQDGSARVAAQCNATVVVMPENHGVSAARNAGLERATQPWIAFLDSDDVWEPSKLAQQWRALQRAPRAGLSFTDLARLGAEGATARDTLPSCPEYRRIPRTPLGDDAYLYDAAEFIDAMCDTNFCIFSSIMVRRDVAQATGFNPQLRYAEDHDFILRALSRTAPVGIEQPLVKYRHHDGGASQNGVALALGALALAENAQRRPDRYPSGAPDRLRSRLWKLHRRAAMAYMRTGGSDEKVREHLLASLRRRPSASALVALALSSVAPEQARSVALARGRA